MIQTVNRAVFTFYLNVLLGQFPDEFLPLPRLSFTLLCSPLLCAERLHTPHSVQTRSFSGRLPAGRAEVFNGRRDTCLTGHSGLLSCLFRSIPEDKCFIVCTGASLRIPCVPQITVLKIPLIVLGPRAGRRAVDLRPAGRSRRQREKRNSLPDSGASFHFFFFQLLLLWVKLERTTRWNELGPGLG